MKSTSHQQSPSHLENVQKPSKTPDEVSWTAIKKPMVAIIEMRPCFNSTDRRRLNVATSPSAVNPTGSQNPTGAWTPNSFSKAVKLTCWKHQGTTLANTKRLYTVSMSRDMYMYGMRQSFDNNESYRMGCPVVLWRNAQIKSQIARVLCICAVDTRCLP